MAQVVERANPRGVSPAGLCALLVGGLAAYSLDRLTDAPGAGVSHRAAGGGWLRGALLGGLAVAALAGLALLPLLPASKIELLVALGAVSLLYPRLKRLPLAKTVLVPGVWTWAALALPTIDRSPLAWRSAAVPLAAPIFASFVAGCLLCDVKDRDQDRRAGVPSLPALLGVRATLWIAALVALLGGALAVEQHRPALAIGALALVALAPFDALLRTDSLGPLAVDVAMTVPGVLVALRWL